MSAQLDLTYLGTELWSVGIDGRQELKLFSKHPCFSVIVSLRGRVEVDRGYITSRQVRSLMDIRLRVLNLSDESRDESSSSRFMRLIWLQESVGLKIFQHKPGHIGIQLIDSECIQRAVCWRGEVAKFHELSSVIRDKSWVSTQYFG